MSSHRPDGRLSKWTPYSFAPQSAVSPSVATKCGGSHALHRLCPIKIDASCFDMNGKIRKIGINIYEQNMDYPDYPFEYPLKQNAGES